MLVEIDTGVIARVDDITFPLNVLPIGIVVISPEFKAISKVTPKTFLIPVKRIPESCNYIQCCRG